MIPILRRATPYGKMCWADYGAFGEIAPGVEGLVHVSEISWNPRLKSASEFLKVGDEVDAKSVSTRPRNPQKNEPRHQATQTRSVGKGISSVTL